MGTEIVKKSSEISGRGGIDAQSLLQSAIDKGVPVETMERLVALTKEIRAELAKEHFNLAMAQFQQNCPPVKKSDKANIRTRTGAGYSYAYASLESIMETITPVMAPLGLSVSYRMQHKDKCVIAIARISHQAGHFEESGEIAMPVVVTEYGANPAQCVGIAATYARRYALLAITGIAPQGEDPDGNPEGDKGSSHAASESAATTQPKQPTQKPQSTAAAPSSEGTGPEEKGIIEKLSPQKMGGKDKNKPFRALTFNGRSVYAWDTKIHPFLEQHDGMQIMAVIERKGDYSNLVTARAYDPFEGQSEVDAIQPEEMPLWE